MKKYFVVFLAVALLAAAIQAEPKPCSIAVRHALEKAFLNEREAAARYKAYAEKATAEGYETAAALFRAAEYAEKVHAKRFESAMKERGIELPPVPEHNITVGETAANMRTSASNEMGERDGVYRDAIHTCDTFGDKEIKALFDQTRDVEAEHVNLFTTGARSLSSKAKKTFYVCDHCGLTSDLDLSFCVLCRTREHPHEID